MASLNDESGGPNGTVSSGATGDTDGASAPVVEGEPRPSTPLPPERQDVSIPEEVEWRWLLIGLGVSLFTAGVLVLLWVPSQRPRLDAPHTEFGVFGYMRASGGVGSHPLSLLELSGSGAGITVFGWPLLITVVLSMGALIWALIAISRCGRYARARSKCLHCGYRFARRHRRTITCPECGKLPRARKEIVPFR